MKFLKPINILFILVLLNFYNVAMAWEAHVDVADREYHAGEVIYLGRQSFSVKDSYTITKKNIYTKQSGQVGISFTSDPGFSAAQNNQGLPRPINVGANGIAVMFVGEAEATFGRTNQKIKWSLSEWELAKTPGFEYTKEMTLDGLTKAQALKGAISEKTYSYLDLFKDSQGKEYDTADFTMNATVRLVVYCNATKCTIPDATGYTSGGSLILNNNWRENYDIPSTLIGDGNPGHIHFHRKASCNFSVSPTTHPLGILSLKRESTELPVSLYDSELATHFKVSCTNDKDKRVRTPHVEFKYGTGAQGYTDANKTMVITNLSGIGIVHSSNSGLSCSTGVPYEQEIEAVKTNTFEKISDIPIYFKICRYTDNAETGPLQTSLQYIYWVD